MRVRSGGAAGRSDTDGTGDGIRSGRPRAGKPRGRSRAPPDPLPRPHHRNQAHLYRLPRTDHRNRARTTHPRLPRTDHRNRAPRNRAPRDRLLRTDHRNRAHRRRLRGCGWAGGRRRLKPGRARA